MNLQAYRTTGKRNRGGGLPFRLLASLSLLVCCGTAEAQIDDGARLFSSTASTATTQYGSLGYGLSQDAAAPASLSYTNLSGIGTATSSPLLVAQTPAPVTVPATTGTIAGTTVPSSTPVYLQPIDPYATPNQSSLFTSGAGAVPGAAQQNIYGSSPKVYSGNFDRFMPETYEAMRRFREATSFEYTFLPGGKNKDDSFGLGEIDMRMQLAIPCRFIPNNGTGQTGPGFFYIAPGGSIVWWDGPVGPPDMSPNGFGAFLDFGMQPQFNDVFSVDAWFRVGVFSDFKKVRSDAFRFQGRAVGLFTVSPNVKVVAGVIYLDRERVKILPTGGVVWTPRDDWMLRLTFPNPKISKRIGNSGCAEWWGYVNADYGGGCWEISGLGKTDYNDIRVGLGVEFETYSRVSGYFELGGSFGRELYSDGVRWSKPPDVVYLKMGFIF